MKNIPYAADLALERLNTLAATCRRHANILKEAGNPEEGNLWEQSAEIAATSAATLQEAITAKLGEGP